MSATQTEPLLSADAVTDPSTSEATRLMCAAAYLDGTFAQDVVDEVLFERHRAVQIPPGVDIGPVAKHCLAARRQKLVRDALLIGDLALVVVLFLATRSVSWLALGFLLAWAIVLWDVWKSTYYVVGKYLSPSAFAAHAAPEPADSEMISRIADLTERQRGNLTVYSGFQPFAGAGIGQSGWSFVIDLRKGADRSGELAIPKPLAVTEIYEGIQESLDALAMENLAICDRLFVSGSDIREDALLLPNKMGPPVSSVDPAALREFVTLPTLRVRHYQCIQVVDWRGELVVSLFLRFAIRNGRLFAELSKRVLPPLKEDLHRADGLAAGIRMRHVAAMIRRSFFASLALWLRSPKVVFRPWHRSRDQLRTVKDIKEDPFFDYGAPVTALDRVRSKNYRRYFQQLDHEMYDKILERTVLDTVVEILDDHDIDTAEIAKAQASIVNQTIMQNNSIVNSTISDASNVAVGSNPSIKTRVLAAAGASNSKEESGG